MDTLSAALFSAWVRALASASMSGTTAMVDARDEDHRRELQRERCTSPDAAQPSHPSHSCVSPSGEPGPGRSHRDGRRDQDRRERDREIAPGPGAARVDGADCGNRQRGRREHGRPRAGNRLAGGRRAPAGATSRWQASARTGVGRRPGAGCGCDRGVGDGACGRWRSATARVRRPMAAGAAVAVIAVLVPPPVAAVVIGVAVLVGVVGAASRPRCARVPPRRRSTSRVPDSDPEQ